MYQSIHVTLEGSTDHPEVQIQPLIVCSQNRLRFHISCKTMVFLGDS